MRLLDTGAEWPIEQRAERASVLAELHAFQAETLGVMGDVAEGLREIAEARRWQDTYVREYALQHGVERAPLAWLKGQHDLSEADLLVMSGDMSAALASLQAMRESIDTLYAPTRQPLSWGTNRSRIGAALHILASSIRARLADPIAEHALLVASLDNQQAGLRGSQTCGDADRQAHRGHDRLSASAHGPCGVRARARRRRPSMDCGGHRHHSGTRPVWLCRERTPVAGEALDRGRRRAGRASRLAAHSPGYERVVASAPAARHLLNGMAGDDEDEGDALWLAGDRRAAEARYRAALARRRQLAVDGLTNGEFASSLVYSTTHFASRLIEAGRSRDARAETRASLDILRAQADAPEAAASRLTEYAWLLLVAQPVDLRNPAIALDYARRALDRPRGLHPDSLGVMAVAQYLTGDVDGAIATARRAYELVPEMRAGRSEVTLRRDIRENLRRHPLKPLPRPVWF